MIIEDDMHVYTICIYDNNLIDDFFEQLEKRSIVHVGQKKMEYMKKCKNIKKFQPDTPTVSQLIDNDGWCYSYKGRRIWLDDNEDDIVAVQTLNSEYADSLNVYEVKKAGF